MNFYSTSRRSEFLRLAVGAPGLVLLALASAPTPASGAGEDGARLGRLQGSAFAGRNRPVAGATALLWAAEAPGRVFITSSDEEGAFRLEGLEDGTYRVEVRRDGFEPVVKSKVALRYPFRAVVEVPMTPLPEGDRPVAAAAQTTPDGRAEVGLEGRVADTSGVPLADVVIRLVDRAGRHDPRQFRAGEDGRFEVRLPAGAWRLNADVVGFLPVRTEVGLSGDTSVEFSMVRQGATYRPTPLELMPRERPIPPAGPRIDPETF